MYNHKENCLFKIPTEYISYHNNLYLKTPTQFPLPKKMYKF